MKVTDWIKQNNIDTTLLLESVKCYDGVRSFEFESWDERRPQTIGTICDLLVKCWYCKSNLKTILECYKDSRIKEHFKISIQRKFDLEAVTQAGLLVLSKGYVELKNKDFSIICNMMEKSFDVLTKMIGNVVFSECEVKYYSGSTNKSTITVGTPDLIVNNMLFEFKVSRSNILQPSWVLQITIYYCLILLTKYHKCILESRDKGKEYLNWCSCHNIRQLVIYNFLNGNYYTINVDDIPRTLLRQIFNCALNSDLPTLQRKSLEVTEQVLFSNVSEIEKLKAEIEYLRSEIRYLKS